MGQRANPTDTEINFGEDELIVSKTDTKGYITYANNVFRRVAGYSGKELDRAPHNIIRHPDMPRCVFKLLWDTLAEGREVFAYVKNLTKTGDFYWVLAHITPSYDASGKLVGFHSNRRKPNRATLNDTIIPLYRQLLQIEASAGNSKEGMMRAYAHLAGALKEKGMSYDEFVHTL